MKVITLRKLMKYFNYDLGSLLVNSHVKLLAVMFQGTSQYLLSTPCRLGRTKAEFPALEFP